MGKARTLAGTVSAGGPLADGAISVAEVVVLQAALDAKSTLVSGTAITFKSTLQPNAGHSEHKAA